MANDMPSEQQESLELADERAMDDPAGWRTTDPDVARETDNAPAGHQASPGDDGMQTDREPTAIAEDAGVYREVGPEEQAVHVETGDER
jgi:hypothetical protein